MERRGSSGDGPPVQDAKDDEGEVLKDMNVLVFQRCVIERRGVPEPEIDIVQGEGDSGISEEAGDLKERFVAHDGLDEPRGCANQHERWSYDGEA